MNPIDVTFQDFEAMEPDDERACVPGVYIFWDPCKEYAVYVGESGNIAQRYRQHRKKKWFREGLELRVLCVPGASDRLMAETVMIFRLRPRHNQAIKLGLRKDGTVFGLQWIR